MRAGEHEVVIFGKTFWPCMESWASDPAFAYDFETLRTAVWTFRMLHTMARSSRDNSPRSCGLNIRHAIKWLRPTEPRMRKILCLIVDLTRALEANGHDDPNERLPTMPATESDER
jgi:hypothetical protein